GGAGVPVAHRRGQGRDGVPLERAPLLRPDEGSQAVKRPPTRQNEADAKKVRCAIYTRKSTEEGLQQEFNTLDAQRESAEAFIASQRQEGWVCLPDRYDDGGFTGGNLERPAVRRLMKD